MEIIIKLAGSLFIGGIGLLLILVCSVVIFVLLKEVLEYIKSNS